MRSVRDRACDRRFLQLARTDQIVVPSAHHRCGREIGRRRQYGVEMIQEIASTAACLRECSDVLLGDAELGSEACWPIGEPFKGFSVFDDAPRELSGDSPRGPILERWVAAMESSS